MFQIIGWIIFGLIVGALAKFIMPGDDPGGIFITIILGIAGSFVGGFVGDLIGIGQSGVLSWVLAVVGALGLLWGYRQISANRKKK